MVKKNKISLLIVDLPAQSFIPYHGGRVAETEWAPIRGSATQNWFEQYNTKNEKITNFLPEVLCLSLLPCHAVNCAHGYRCVQSLLKITRTG